MKEIGKLIELLNEYEAKLEETPLARRKWREESGILYRRFMNVEDAERMVISKSFGFIKWLVENDKIDTNKIDTRLVRYVESHYDEAGYWMEYSYEDYSDYKCLLMLLSISSSPIEDLISYLK